MSIMATAPSPKPTYPSSASSPRMLREVAAMVRAMAPLLTQ
ncbi:hypothetical protein FHU36_000317 [Nonomuraea muscovyensis]|uniref:Uncharacterized protein n=1 Tax=Nonomuraea muscovyensis TaxID=1124761 RepID=A0A7X0BWD5_9ACTN|nr:hypothetical protein [Nonomuraea muscovyensis]